MSDSAPGRVALVVVSHSEPLALAAVALAGEMLQGQDVQVVVAAGVDGDDGGTALGTDAVRIKEAVEACAGAAGVLVLLDLGSAVMSAELALDLLDDPDLRDRVLLSPAPLVEGLVVAVVSAAGGASLAEVAAEAHDATLAKAAHLGEQEPAPAPSPASGGEVTGRFTVSNPHGLHARPAARLVAEVRGSDAEVRLRNLTTGTGPVPAGSLSRVALLGAQQGHEVEVSASGPVAQEAVDRVLALAARAFDEVPEAGRPAEAPTAGPRGASPGVVVGPVVRLHAAPVAPDDARGTHTEEHARLDAALQEVRDAVGRDRRTWQGTAEAGIFEAHLALLDDEALVGRARDQVADVGAVAAWQSAVAALREEWEALPDAYLRERAADVVAVGEQVLRALTGGGPPRPSGRGVLVADDLTPADAAALDADLVEGVVLVGGSPTSHAAILARARAIPLVVGAGSALRDLAEGTVVALDGTTGELHLDPPAPLRSSYEKRAAAEREARAADLAAAQEEAVTTDGVRVVVGANLGSVVDARTARECGADKAGLVRTELLFLDRDTAPSEDEQAETYAALATALDRRVTLRTLDVGGDKPLPYVAAPREDNPFLGVRGVRLSLRHPDLLRTQLAAMARVAREHPVEVMLPMVTDPAEVQRARALLPDGAEVRLGIMVEVPSTALRLAAFAPHVDFVSIGTNDLTQYAVAAERGNPHVADLADPLDPGVLRLVALVVEAGLPTGVCGEAAGDPSAVPLLVGLGVRELSVAPPAVPRVKAQLRTLDTSACADLAREALTLPDAGAVRRLVGGA